MLLGRTALKSEDPDGRERVGNGGTGKQRNHQRKCVRNILCVFFF